MPAPHAFVSDTGRPLWLTHEQATLLSHPSASVVIAALAGTGKTTTLACRAVQALRDAAAHQRSLQILVLACSQSGIVAFRDRLLQLVPAVPPALHITTMERWAARHLRQLDPQVHFETDPVALRAHAQQAWAQLQVQLEREPDDLIHMGHAPDYAALQDFQRRAKSGLLLQQVQDSEQDLSHWCAEHDVDYTLARWFVAYERHRIDHCGDVRFYAQGDCTYALAMDDSLVHSDNTPPYDLIVFDELHDLDLASLHVLRHLLLASNAAFIGAGDFYQHIDAQAWSVFQAQLHQLADFLPLPTQTLPLTQSRRFGPPVADAVQQMFGLPMRGSPRVHSRVVHLKYRTDADCHAVLLDAQRQLAAAASAQGTTSSSALTVVLRHPHDALGLEWTVHAAGHTYRIQGLKPFYERREIALLLGLMYAHGMQAPNWKAERCSLPPTVLSAFVDGALFYGQGQLSPEAGTVPPDLHAMGAQMHHHPAGIWRFLLGETHLQGGQQNFAAFGKFLQLPLSLQQDAHALMQAANVHSLFDGVHQTDADRASWQSLVAAWLQCVQGLSVPQVLTRVARLVQTQARNSAMPGSHGFHFTTVAAAKGQEFAHVAIPWMEPGRFPAPMPHAQAFLERNRLYVAMTRARSTLFLLEHADRPVPAWQVQS